jgi:hypothetical protein
MSKEYPKYAKNILKGTGKVVKFVHFPIYDFSVGKS